MARLAQMDILGHILSARKKPIMRKDMERRYKKKVEKLKNISLESLVIAKKIKMIATDMDGTALNKHHELSDKTVNALQMLSKKGIAILLATGRMPSAVIRHANRIGTADLIVSNNGALVINILTKEIIFHETVKQNVLKDVVSFAKNSNAILHINLAEEILVENHITKLSHKYAHELGVEYSIIDSFYSIKEKATSLLLLGNRAELLDFLNSLPLQNDFSYVFIPWFDDTWMLQFLAPNISKGAAVIEVAKKLNISSSEIIGFGDSYNDLELIKQCGIGIAMENACNELREAADFITKSNEEDGLVFALHSLNLL